MIEKGTHLRVKLIGTRSDVGSMFAIGSIKEDFLGFDDHVHGCEVSLTAFQDFMSGHRMYARVGDYPRPLLSTYEWTYSSNGQGAVAAASRERL